MKHPKSKMLYIVFYKSLNLGKLALDELAESQKKIKLLKTV
jgi:hypothetical protein